MFITSFADNIRKLFVFSIQQTNLISSPKLMKTASIQILMKWSYPIFQYSLLFVKRLKNIVALW